MSQSESTSDVSSTVMRVLAGFVLILALSVFVIQVLVALQEKDHPDPTAAVPVPTVSYFVPPALTFVGGVALWGLFEGIARLLSREPGGAITVSSGSKELSAAIGRLQSSLPAILEQHRQAGASNENAEQPVGTTVIDAVIQQHLEKMVKLLEEMKENSLLDESQRQVRRQQVANRRKQSKLEEVGRLIHHQEWTQADALLHLLESLHPGDAEVLALRNQLDDSRIETQATEWEKLTREVEDLMALNQYDTAAAAANQFLERYPSHVECQQLVTRVNHEYAVYQERTVTRGYDDIRLAVEGRQWRQALTAIQSFLEQFPQHPRSAKIRQQVPVIQKNAEIEERHELEDRIRELVASRKYAQAADWVEDLLSRFPESSQAAYLAELLPRLRERVDSAAVESTATQ